jgi:hypothetical protein
MADALRARCAPWQGKALVPLGHELRWLRPLRLLARERPCAKRVAGRKNRPRRRA